MQSYFILAINLPEVPQSAGNMDFMLTTACEMGCYYCTFRAGRNYRRVTFQPEELASAYMEVYQGGFVQGLFLSTGLARAYFEAFNPVPNTPLEGHPPTDLLRQNRLYQA